MPEAHLIEYTFLILYVASIDQEWKLRLYHTFRIDSVTGLTPASLTNLLLVLYVMS